MLNQKAIIIGATGLVGYELLSELCSKKYYASVISLARKPLKLLTNDHQHYIIDFEALDKFEKVFQADDLFICLGTTLKKAGSKERFIAIDKNYVLNSARLFLAQGGKRVFLVSSTGANAESKIFYSRIKGETENELKRMNVEQLYIFRPGLLLGNRSEHRAFELWARKAYGAINALLQPSLNTYIGTKANDLARAMISCAVDDSITPKTFSNKEIKKISSNEETE